MLACANNNTLTFLPLELEYRDIIIGYRSQETQQLLDIASCVDTNPLCKSTRALATAATFTPEANMIASSSDQEDLLPDLSLILLCLLLLAQAGFRHCLSDG